MLTLGENSLNWALKHTIMFGDTDVFPTPFEYLAVQDDWHNLRDHLSSQNVLEWTVRPHRILLAPKGKYGFRAVTQLDPYPEGPAGRIHDPIDDRHLTLVGLFKGTLRYYIHFASHLNRSQHADGRNDLYVKGVELSKLEDRFF